MFANFNLQINAMSKAKFSRVISGTMTWGIWGKEMNKSQMSSLVNHCVDIGISSFDMADIYGGYTTEAHFGDAFAESGVRREDVQFISKCGIQYICDARPIKVKHYDYSKDYIISSVEASLKHLKTDFLDLFLLHRPSPLMEPNEVMEAVAKLAQEGKIRDFGVSNFTPSQMDLISSEVPIKVNQIEFSLTNHNAMHDGTLDYMMLNDITPMAWSPLGSVFREDTEQTRRIHKQLGELMDKYQADEDQLLLSWSMRHPAGIYPVVGTTNKARLEKAIQASEIQLELEDWFLILVAGQGHKVP